MIISNFCAHHDCGDVKRTDKIINGYNTSLRNRRQSPDLNRQPDKLGGLLPLLSPPNDYF